ncbi:MAG TPA: hypothetical protein VHI71_09960 [Actinomycetota bacterium]|nr:hypothetical protein [Actinomycetota bacterium]
METVVYADRSGRGKLRFTGPQRAWFLHQIMTQAFEDLAPGDARDTAMITAHGRMLGYLEVVATEDALLAHFEPDLIATLPDEIRRYVFATRVEIEDVSADLGLVLVAGEGWEIAAKTADAVVHPTTSLGIPAGYLWVPAADVPATIRILEDEGAQRASEEKLEEIRIVQGVPRWGYEMDFKTIPQEAGIDDSAVHFDKGCYVGQEAMAKIHFRGKVNRRLARVEADSDLRSGVEVTADGTTVGKITSASGPRGLALVKHTVAAGAEVTAGDVAARLVS